MHYYRVTRSGYGWIEDIICLHLCSMIAKLHNIKLISVLVQTTHSTHPPILS